jgi:hypothetical protein
MNKHIENLEKIREQYLLARRDSAEKVTSVDIYLDNEAIVNFSASMFESQKNLEALDRMIDDERRIEAGLGSSLYTLKNV